MYVFICYAASHVLYMMRAIATDFVAWSVCMFVCLCVCPSVTIVSSAKMAEPIEIPFGGLTHVGPGNHVLDWVKVGRIHSSTRGVTTRRCGLASKFFDYLFR